MHSVDVRLIHLMNPLDPHAKFTFQILTTDDETVMTFD